jgi:hypothetical protein
VAEGDAASAGRYMVDCKVEVARYGSTMIGRHLQPAKIPVLYKAFMLYLHHEYINIYDDIETLHAIVKDVDKALLQLDLPSRLLDFTTLKLEL